MHRNERAVARRMAKLIFAALVTLLCFIEELARQRWVPAILCGVAAGILFFLRFKIGRPRDDSDSEYTKSRSDDRLFIIGGLVCIFILILVAFTSGKK
jgi:4-hydroxybenzoate polyprenyltransferase